MKAGRAFIGALIGLLPTAAAAAPMTYMTSSGAKENPVTPLIWGTLGISAVVVVIIGVLIVTGMLRRPASPILERPTGIASPGGLGFIYIGVGVSAVVLLGVLIWSMVVLANVSVVPRNPDLTIDITGHQWWWGVRYTSDTPSRMFDTANEIHIPVGKRVLFKLRSADVIHSFWVPALAGKTDVIPGQVNEAWIEADKPGVYRGQCAEYCGVQHAHMIISIIADSPAEFENWWNRQLDEAPPPLPDERQVVMGEAAFVTRCGGCHTVRGTSAGGRVGPDLTHLMSRQAIASETIPNDPGHLAAWIADPQGVKPGAQMPDLGLSGGELTEIRAFLSTLK